MLSKIGCLGSISARMQPDINGVGVALGVKRDFWGAEPACSHLFSQKSRMVMFLVSNPGHAKNHRSYRSQVVLTSRLEGSSPGVECMYLKPLGSGRGSSRCGHCSTGGS